MVQEACLKNKWPFNCLKCLLAIYMWTKYISSILHHVQNSTWHLSRLRVTTLIFMQANCHALHLVVNHTPCYLFPSKQAQLRWHTGLLDDAKHMQRALRHEKSISLLSLCVGWSPAVKMISGQLKDACASSTSAQGCFYETLIERCFFFALFYLFILILSGQQKVSAAIERVTLS